MSAKGGITEGKSHKEGGIPMVVKSTGQQVELEGGEGVINKRNMASEKKFEFEGKEKTICEIASDINSADGNGVQIDCDNVTGTKYKYDKGGKILNEDEEESFKEWMDDGNVVEFETDVYSTQDAQYSNKLKGMDELRKYFKKEFLSDSYEGGGSVEDWFDIGVTQNPDKGSALYTGLYVYGYEPRYTDLGKGFFSLQIPKKHKERYKEIGLQHPSDTTIKNDSYEGGGGIDEIKDVEYTWREQPSLVKIIQVKKTSKGNYSGLFSYTDENRTKWERLGKYFGKELFDGKIGQKMKQGGSIDLEKYEYNQLIGKYVNIYSMGVELPSEHRIEGVMFSSPQFRYRQLTLKFDRGIAPIEIEDIPKFLNNDIVDVNDNKEDFGVQLIPNQFAKGGDVRDMSWYQDFKKQELKRGTEHEMEHIESIKKFKKKGVSDREVAKAIAKDHLDENENYYIELALEFSNTGAYMLVPSDIINVVGFDEQFANGGSVSPYQSVATDDNDKLILNKLRTIDDIYSVTSKEKQLLSSFKGDNVVNQLSNAMIQKIYSVLFKYHNIEHPIKNLYLSNIGVGNILLFAPTYIDHTICSYDKDNRFSEIEEEISSIVTLGKRASILTSEVELHNIEWLIQSLTILNNKPKN
jgi:hypothetical protein